jgi:hypothetical protein
MNPRPAERAHAAAGQLRLLADDLERRGFVVSVTGADGGARLTVVSNAVAQVDASLSIAPDDNGAWWFWWPWGDRLALACDVEAAAFKVAYVLTPQAG